MHGFPKVMGVLTHLDGFKDQKKLKKTKKALKHRFWAEIYQGIRSIHHTRLQCDMCVLRACVGDHSAGVDDESCSFFAVGLWVCGLLKPSQG